MDALERIIPQKPRKYYCESCDYATSKKCDYDRHTNTLRHQEVLLGMREVIPIRHCIVCDYTASRKSDYDKHLLTAKHKIAESKNEQVFSLFRCEHCNYKTSLKTNYSKHLMSNKHIMNSNTNNAVIRNVSPSINESNIPNNEINPILLTSNNTFNEINNHKELNNQNNSNNCTNNTTSNHNNHNDKEIEDLYNEQANNNLLMKMIMMLIERNEKLENYVMHQTEISNKQTELMEVISKKEFSNNTITNTNCNNTNNNNNNTINIFLNEKCKDAMNMTDFIHSIKYNAETLKHMGEHGFSSTINMLMNEKLNELTLYQRPIHCTDKKRAIMYIKDNDKWLQNDKEKTMKNEIINKYIPMMEKDNRVAFQKWCRDNPDMHEIGHADYENWFSIAREVNNGRNKEVNDEKILKNICNETHLTRDMIKDS